MHTLKDLDTDHIEKNGIIKKTFTSISLFSIIF